MFIHFNSDKGVVCDNCGTTSTIMHMLDRALRTFPPSVYWLLQDVGSGHRSGFEETPNYPSSLCSAFPIVLGDTIRSNRIRRTATRRHALSALSQAQSAVLSMKIELAQAI